MTESNNLYSERTRRGDAPRVRKNFRLHPDRCLELDVIAKATCVTQARAIETMIESCYQWLTGEASDDGPGD